MAISLIATDAYPYAGRSLAKGDAFEASEQDANTLKLIGRAVDAPVAARPSRLLQTRELEPAGTECPGAIGVPGPLGVAGILADDDTPPKRRQYRRRDLIPEP